MVVQINPFYLRFLLKYWIVGALLVDILIMLLLPFDISFNYFASMALTFAAVIYVFYLNRNELASIKFESSLIVFSFVNKSILKRKDLFVEPESLKIDQSEDIVIFLLNNKVVAKLRRQSVNSESWTNIMDYLGSAIGHKS